MDTEQDYIDKIWELYPRKSTTPLSTIKLVDRAVRKYPNSPELWVLRGCLIQLADENCPHSLEDAINSFKKAVEVDPSFDDAWKEIGHFYDAIDPNRKLSLEAFKKAKDLRLAKKYNYAIFI